MSHVFEDNFWPFISVRLGILTPFSLKFGNKFRYMIVTFLKYAK